ncbi:MAG: hypothetical protein HY907_05610 [Deltaproteobacteria bacterium]|nr:hypothetical protein [Deltaproteobacteria bacterium]
MNPTVPSMTPDRARRRLRPVDCILLGSFASIASLPRPALAQEQGPDPSGATTETTAPAGSQPTLFHLPPSSAEADEPLELTATLAEAWQLAQLDLVYRRVDREGWMRVPFRQVSTGDFVAVIPGPEVAAPAVEYYVESLDRENRTRRHFASPEHPHRVEVVGITSAQEEERQEEKFGGRHRFSARTDWSSFGARSQLGWVPDETGYPAAETRERKDDYWHLHADYTYRLLGIVQAIHFGFGVLRGHAPELDYRFGLRPDDPERVSEDRRIPGFNYGWTGITFQFHRYFGMGADIYLGATQLGFDGGGGLFVRVGNTAETHFDLAFDYVSNMGYRAWATFWWDTVPYVPMSLTAEFTDWPYPDDENADGVRLWYAAEAHVWGGLVIDARVGYAARHGSNTGGPIAGGGVSYQF